MRHRSALGCTGVALLLVLASCGGDDDDSADDSSATVAPSAESDGNGDEGGDAAGVVNGTPDPCQLLPAGAITAVLGNPPPEPKTTREASPPLNLRQCDWSVDPTDTSLRAIYLSVQTTDGIKQGDAGGGQYGASDQYEGMRGSFTQAVDVAGLGDAAFYTDAAETDLQVLAGDTFFSVTAQIIGGGVEPITANQLRTLAEVAMANL